MDSFDRIALIANPAAQNGRGAAAIRLALQELHACFGEGRVTLFETAYPGHGMVLAEELGDHFGTIVALGGDGLVHEIVNGLMRKRGRRQQLGVIPMGSGNDYANTLGMSSKVDTAVRQIAQGHVRTVDVGCCNGEFFAETLSFGLDAAIALGTVPLRKRTNLKGTPLYLASALNQLFLHLRKHRFRMELVDGQRVHYRDGVAVPVADASLVEGECYLLAVQNGKTYGGGFLITPDARLDDGLFDICLAKPPLTPLSATPLLLSAKDGKHTAADALEFYRARGLRLTFDARPPVQIDGEAHIAEDYQVSLCPDALRVLAGE